MKSLKRFILITSVALSACVGAFAVPAKPGLVTMRQADGTELKVRVVGDERSHHYLTEDGYLIVNKENIFYYASTDAHGNIVRSDIQARPVGMRSAEARDYLAKVDLPAVMTALENRDVRRRAARAPRRNVGLFETGFPSKGEQKGLVVLVEYKDVKFNLSDPYDYFNRMLNEDGFSDYGGTGCAAEYFRESSVNQFRPRFDVYGPVTLSQNMSYYGGNDYNGNDSNPEQMAIEACRQLDPTVDFSEYDRDGDGYIDNVFVFYAGRGEASGGSPNSVWPHSWNVTSATNTPYIFDGVRLDRYACSNEWEGSRPDGVGTFIHEFSHVMGLPDLYATSYTGAFTPGAWSVLDYGPYNNDGRTPPLYSVYERYALGWISPQVIDRPANMTMETISRNKACIIPTADENEFFLLENRQQEGWDKYIPGHGMLVWHVDFDEYVWAQNTVNNNASHQYVDLEEADGRPTEYTRAGDAFPGTGNVTSFTDDTNPSMRTWNGTRLNLPITGITETGGVIRFAVAGGVELPDPVKALGATDITAVSFTANWEPSPVVSSYKISVYTKQTTPGGKEMTVYVDGYNMRDADGARATAVTGLSPETTYYYVVYAVGEGGRSEASNEIIVTTSEATFEYLSPKSLPAEKVTDKSFEARWNMMADATGYLIDIFRITLGEPFRDTVDFADGVRNLPAGWKTNSTLSYANTAYSGEAVPSLRFARDGYIESPLYSADVRSLTFWHRGVQATADNRIIVSVCNEKGAWKDVASLPVVNAAGGSVTRIDSIPSGTRAVSITYDLQTKGSLALDDIIVEWGGDENMAGGYTLELTYATDRVDIKGLEPSSTYYYRVTGCAGGMRSLPSAKVKVTTLPSEETGVGDVAYIRKSVRTYGRKLILDTGAKELPITVFGISGHVIYAGKVNGPAVLDLPAAGLYIVRLGDENHKISVR